MRLRSLTPFPGSGQARDTSGRRGLFSSCRKRRPGGRRRAAWGGEDRRTRELDSRTTRQQGGLLPSGTLRRGGQGAGTPLTARHPLPPLQPAPKWNRALGPACCSQPGPGRRGQRERGRGRGSAGRVQGGGGASAPGPPPRPITEPTGSWLPHAPHRTSEAASPLALDLGPHSSSRWTPSAPAPLVREPWL